MDSTCQEGKFEKCMIKYIYTFLNIFQWKIVAKLYHIHNKCIFKQNISICFNYISKISSVCNRFASTDLIVKALHFLILNLIIKKIPHINRKRSSHFMICDKNQCISKENFWYQNNNVGLPKIRYV